MKSLGGKSLKAVLARGSVGVLAVKVLGVAMMFGLQLLLTRVLGADRFGDYVYALNWVFLLGMFLSLGFEPAALRFVSSYSGQGDYSRLRGFVRCSVLLVTLSGVSAGAVFAGVVLFTSSTHSALKVVLLLAATLLPLHALLLLRASLVQGLKHVVLAHFPRSILRPLFVGALVLCSLIWTSRPSAEYVMFLEVVIAFLLVLFLSVVFRRKAPKTVFETSPVFETKLWLKASLPMMVFLAVRLAMNRTSILVIGTMSDTTNAGIYAVVERVVSVIALGLFAVNTIVAPMVAQLYAQKRMQELQQIVTFGARGILFVALGIGIPLALAGPWILRLFGPEFVAGYYPLLILIGGQIVNSIAGSVGFLMIMTGHQFEAAKWAIVAAILNFVLNVVLIHFVGILGAAIATALAGSLWNITLVFLVRKRIQIYPTVFGGLGARKD